MKKEAINNEDVPSKNFVSLHFPVSKIKELDQDRHLGSNLTPVLHLLSVCDLGQVTEPLCTSVSSPIK